MEPVFEHAIDALVYIPAIEAKGRVRLWRWDGRTVDYQVCYWIDGKQTHEWINADQLTALAE